ncbi:MAG TPA: hypothetical protein VLA16_20525 [Ideonella sp.]|nr:hypothetical protein [Ideonella sp.]
MARAIVSAGLVAGLTACGGGGADLRPALPTLSQDTLPAGDRLDLRDDNYFPAAAGDSWTYTTYFNGDMVVDSQPVRTVTSSTANSFVIVETDGAESQTTSYLRTNEGLVAVNPFGDIAPPAARSLIGDLLEYAEPFYAAGATRQMIRQGDWGADLDGDGVNESFRLVVSQTLVGFEDFTLPDGSVAEVARFRNVTALTLSPSDRDLAVTTATGTEEAWWAPGIGKVASSVVVTDAAGVPGGTQAFVLAGATVGGTVLFQP